MSKSSRRARAAQLQAAAADADFVHSAADKVGPMTHQAADRLAPLAQSAADRVGPLAEAAADRIGAAADRVSPLAHSAAERLGPLAHNAADRVGPLVHTAADRVGPVAHTAADRVAPVAQSAVDRIGPLASQAVDRVSPYAQQAVDRVSPYTHTAAERIAPIAANAKLIGTNVAHDARERLSPALDTAKVRVRPAVDVARDKVSDDLLPRLSGALSAAAASPVAIEAAKRGHATLAAAKGELILPEQQAKKKSRWVKRLAIVAAIGAAAAVVFRKFFANKDADWQAARPSTPYAPPTPTPTPAPAPADAEDVEVPGNRPGSVETPADAREDPQAGATAHGVNLEANGEPVPDQPAEGGEATVEGVEAAVEGGEAPVDDTRGGRVHRNAGRGVPADGRARGGPRRGVRAGRRDEETTSPPTAATRSLVKEASTTNRPRSASLSSPWRVARARHRRPARRDGVARASTWATSRRRGT